MTDPILAQWLALCTGLLLLTAILITWRRSVSGAVRLLGVQGAALAGIVAVLAVGEGAPALFGVALLVLAVKALLLPVLLRRSIAATGADLEDFRSVAPTLGLLAASALTVLAYLVGQPLAGPDPAGRAVPAGLALVLIGFWVLLTRHRAASALTGFLMIDNGISAVGFLAAGGVPLVVELGVSLDVVLVVLVARILGGRLGRAGRHDLTQLQELHD